MSTNKKKDGEVAEKKPMPTKKSNYEFHYKFSEAEIKAKARQLAQVCSEKNRIEDEKKTANSNFKSKLDSK